MADFEDLRSESARFFSHWPVARGLAMRDVVGHIARVPQPLAIFIRKLVRTP